MRGYQYLPFLAFASAVPTFLPQDCTESNESSCQNIILPIQATANNTLLPPFPDSTAPGTFLKYLGSLRNASTVPFTNTVSGVYNISATYCEPIVKVDGREDAIQMLLHGVAYTKEYWSGLGYPGVDFRNEYSWVSHARSQGYATIAIDNLGNGNSSHPDPINIVQTPLQLEIMRQIIHGLRNCTLPSITKPYKSVIFAGYSYGSIVGRALATLHPTDAADAYVLTAASSNITGLMDLPAVLQGRAASAADPTQFGHLPPAYLSVSPQGIRDSLYSFPDDFSPGLLAYDQLLPHVFVASELAASAPREDEPSNFTGPVLVVTGRYDQIMCGVANITAKVADCGVGKDSNPGMTRELFPKASRFDTFVPDRTGHNINTHFSAPESFGAVSAWLESVGF